MKRTTTNTARVHPLLFDACRCGINGRSCLTCRLRLKHYCAVQQRRAKLKART